MTTAVEQFAHPTLMPTQQWQPKIEAERIQLTPIEGRLYDAIWLGFHSRHIGITPKLATSLAKCLLHDDQLTSPWLELHTQLRQKLLKQGNQQQTNELENIQSGIFLAVSPVYVINNLAKPLVAQACSEINKNYLFCQDNHCDEPDVDYIAYHNALVNRIAKLVETAPWQMPLTEHALVMSAYTRRINNPFQGRQLSPKRDFALAPLMFEQTPDIKTDNRAFPANPIYTVRDDQVIKERQQSGVSGVMHTHREADLDHSLLSEFLNPRLIRLDRLFNTGYHIIEREPKQEKRRHILIEAIFMPELFQQPQGAIAKACWMHFAAKIATPLRRNKLIQSEFRTIEGNTFEHVQSDAHRLADIPLAQWVQDGGDDIISFVNYLTFYPGFNSQNGKIKQVEHSDATLDSTDSTFNSQTTDDQETDEQRIEEQAVSRSRYWLRQAQQMQQDHPNWQTQKNSRKSTLQLDTFGHVYYMIFTSQSNDTHDPTRLLGAYRGALNADPGNNQHVVVTAIPDNLAQFNQTRFRSRSARENSLSSLPDLTENCAILIKSWLKDFAKEIWHV